MPSYSFEPDGTNQRDDVRLLISDVGGDDGTKFIFSDEEIDRFIALRSNSFRAAATALRVMGSNAIFVDRRIRYLGLETDGPAEADAVRKMAEEYEMTADKSADEQGIEFALMERRQFGP